MKTVKGKYTSAKVFTDNVEDYALAQIKMLCDNEVFKDCIVRVMPDVHPGKVGPIGFTSTIGNKIMPNIIGSDIGCGVLLAQINKNKIDLPKLDSVIKNNIPAGFNIRDTAHDMFKNNIDINKFHCKNAINWDKVSRSIGTLGGGNHFIEVDKDDENNLYVAIHTGSRCLGQEVTDYYLNEGQKYLKERGINIPYELTWLEGDLMKKYIEDVMETIFYAEVNRSCILRIIMKKMKLHLGNVFIENRHNFITLYNIDDNLLKGLLRKGAIMANIDHNIVIPINMKEGIILGTGLGNHDWNYSAPHGSGRIMNRENVKSNFTVNQFKKEMNGIYCSCIGKDTLDESPFVYRGLEEIKEVISDTVSIDNILKPVYNYKAGSKEK